MDHYPMRRRGVTGNECECNTIYGFAVQVPEIAGADYNQEDTMSLR